MALSDADVQKIRLVLASSGWNDVMQPAIERRGRQAVKALTLTRAERGEEFKGTDFDTDDDVLRAVIRDCNWMIVVWPNEVAVSDANRARDELDRQEYSNAGQSGTANPSG